HPDGRAYRIVGAMSDVTEERQRHRELETARAEAAAAYRQGDAAPGTPAEERYALAMESINYGLYDWDIETGAIYFAPGLRIPLIGWSCEPSGRRRERHHRDQAARMGTADRAGDCAQAIPCHGIRSERS